MKELSNINILLDKLHFPEGPAFDKKGALWFVEQNNGSLGQYYKGVLYRHYVGGRPNGIAIDHRDLIWFCDSIRNEIRVYNPNSTATYTILSKIEDSPLNLPNDLAFDDLGNLLFTCSGSELKKGDGYFCAWSARMGLHKIDSVRYYPNGLAFNKGTNKLYIAETGTQCIWKGDWDSSSFSWNNPEVYIKTGGPIGPDGMAFDESGSIYVAVFGSSSIHVYDKAGKLDRKIDLPGSNPTNCAFDPFGRLGLIITEAEKGQLLSYKSDQKGMI